MMYSVTATHVFPKLFFNLKNVTRCGVICVNIMHSRPKNKSTAFPKMIFTKFTTTENKKYAYLLFYPNRTTNVCVETTVRNSFTSGIKVQISLSECHETHITQQRYAQIFGTELYRSCKNSVENVSKYLFTSLSEVWF